MRNNFVSFRMKTNKKCKKKWTKKKKFTNYSLNFSLISLVSFIFYTVFAKTQKQIFYSKLNSSSPVHCRILARVQSPPLQNVNHRSHASPEPTSFFYFVTSKPVYSKAFHLPYDFNRNHLNRWQSISYPIHCHSFMCWIEWFLNNAIA